MLCADFSQWTMVKVFFFFPRAVKLLISHLFITSDERKLETGSSRWELLLNWGLPNRFFSLTEYWLWKNIYIWKCVLSCCSWTPQTALFCKIKLWLGDKNIPHGLQWYQHGPVWSLERRQHQHERRSHTVYCNEVSKEPPGNINCYFWLESNSRFLVPLGFDSCWFEQNESTGF